MRSLSANAGNRISGRQLKAFRRFLEQLLHGKDLDLVILKAHLLIEEQVNALIQERLKNPAVLLGEERFESSYRIGLAQSFFDPEFQPWVWHALKQLNTLRNRIAHKIEPKGASTTSLTTLSAPYRAESMPLLSRSALSSLCGRSLMLCLRWSNPGKQRA